MAKDPLVGPDEAVGAGGPFVGVPTVGTLGSVDRESTDEGDGITVGSTDPAEVENKVEFEVL